MSAFLFRLGRSCARHPFRVLGIWLVAAVAVVTLQGAAGGHYDNSIRIPGVESQRAADTLRDRFPAQSGKTARIVFHTTDGPPRRHRSQDGHRAARQQLATGHDVTGVTDPFVPQSAALSAPTVARATST